MTRAYSISAADIVSEKERVKGDVSKFEFGNVIKLDQLELRKVGPSDVHLRILAASGEHNVDHAVLADTDSIAAARGGKIYPGQLARSARCSPSAPRSSASRPATSCSRTATVQPDAYGFPLRIWAYDQPESIGWYSEEAVVGDWQLVHAPLDCGLSLWEIAALPLRAPTAYHMWRRALGIFRLKVADTKLRRLNVLSFGGGVGECFLMLAKSEGHHAYFCSGSPGAARGAREAQGIHGIDQKAFNRFATARGRARVPGRGPQAHRTRVNMHIVCDMLRGPVFDAGLAVAARCGVNVSRRLAALAASHLQLDAAVGEASHDRSHSLRDGRGLRGGHRALRRGLQADGPQRDLRLRGPAARDARDVRRHADGHSDRPRGQGAPGIGAEARLMAPSHWLIKSEPELYPFSQLVAEKKTLWEGVRNHEARNNLAAMEVSDLVLFYHSHDSEVVGIARVTGKARPDPTSDDPRWVAVEIEAVQPFVEPVSLATIKADRAFAKLKLVTHSRLSVLPVEPRQFERLLGLGHTRLQGKGRVKSAKASGADAPY